MKFEDAFNTVMNFRTVVSRGTNGKVKETLMDIVSIEASMLAWNTVAIAQNKLDDIVFLDTDNTSVSVSIEEVLDYAKRIAAEKKKRIEDDAAKAKTPEVTSETGVPAGANDEGNNPSEVVNDGNAPAEGSAGNNAPAAEKGGKKNGQKAQTEKATTTGSDNKPQE